MWLLNKSTKKVSSRKQIQIKEVRDNILILPHNRYRLIIETSSVNFELKSEEEQDVIIDSFQTFLNSLPNQLQIVIRVREVDIDRYLEQINVNRNNEKNNIYKDQLTNYSEFIKKLVSGNKILSRRFYIIIPYKSEDNQTDFDIVKEQIYLQRDVIMRGMEKLGMKARQLANIEILDLFYSMYNPSQIKTQELKGETAEVLTSRNYVSYL